MSRFFKQLADGLVPKKKDCVG